MKKLFVLLMLAALKVSGQVVIERKDGTKIEAASVRVEANNKRIAYFEKDNAEPKRLKFKSLRLAHWDDFVFRTFDVKGKSKGYYVMAETATKTLVVSKRIRVKSRGGFESTYVAYEVTVLDKQKNPLESLHFTDESHAEKKRLERSKVIPMIQRYFADCPELLKKAALFESPGSDTENATVLVLLNDPVYTECRK